MEDNAKVVESLLEKATEFGKTNIELFKLKAVDKASDVLSTYLPLAVVFILFAIFLVFFNLGLAFWLGDVTGNIYYGFFIVAGFYGFIGLIVRVFMYKWLKRVVGNMIIKLLLR